MPAAYTLVNTAELWGSALPSLRRSPRLGVDLEGDFDLHRYGKHLCLLQVFDGSHTWLIDPLAALDLAPLWEIFEDTGVEKIFFGAQTDIRVLKALAGCQLRNLVDLHEAAKYLSLEGQNLPFLAKHYLQAVFVKNAELQVSNWNTRPLSPAQLDYAADDAHLLLGIWEKMRAELVEKRKWKVFQARMRTMEGLEFKANPTPWLKSRNVHLLLADQIPLLKYLWLARDEAARRLDVPAARVIPSENLVQICLNPPLPPAQPGLTPFPGVANDAQFMAEAFWLALKLGQNRS